MNKNKVPSVPDAKVEQQPTAASPADIAGETASVGVADQQAEAVAREADAEQAQQIREEMQEDHPQDPAVKAAKDTYTSGYLESHQESLTSHLEELRKAYKKERKAEEQAKLEVAYEATLDFCIENGKSTVKEVTRAIVAGIGQGLISYNHLSYYQRYVNQIPPVEFWLGKNEEELKQAAKDLDPINGEQHFRDHYWQVVLNDPKVRARTQKAVSENQWDHDFMAEIVAAGDANVSRIIATSSNSKTAIENAFVGSYESLYRNYKRNPNTEPETLRRQLGSWLVLHGASVQGRAYQNVVPIEGRRFTLNEATLVEVPRTSAQEFGSDLDMADINGSVWEMIKPLEPKLFALLQNHDLQIGELQDYLQKTYKIQIDSFDDFYDGIEAILKHILPDKKAKKGFSLFRWASWGK